ncbi:signal recognition particle, SRP9/SRP14 subunit [Nadsonia fulvescens var. elongata DSM 6958]|uniref:Signal recognition particle subunit SRP14 n=1 Tax=Nadsonia fulvescens var. elongata DSM 6958 TaxID=857566 RepID=A0A1E3PIF2_9ASCO|nr:signal recognition particle, SRP9/SRP14 subunit [Nadsonia fulvescens var. elongata DSM 6958]
MSTGRLSNEQFLVKLRELFSNHGSTNSVYLGQKRYTPFDDVTSTKSDDLSDLNPSDSPFALLFRATNGKGDKSLKIKISTIVDSDQLEEFWLKYTDVVKGGMTGLRKKDKKKQKQKAKKSKST